MTNCARSASSRPAGAVNSAPVTGDRQTRAAKTEQRTSLIRAFELLTLPGLTQIPEYARHVLTVHAELHGVSTDIEQAVSIRAQRQTVLYDTAKSIELLIMESALRYTNCPPDVMVSQIDRLMTLASGIANVRFGIIPTETQLPTIAIHGFWVFDNSVIIETIDSEITAEDPEDLALYNRVMDRLWTVAVTGNDAGKILLACSRRWAAMAKGKEHEQSH